MNYTKCIFLSLITSITCLFAKAQNRDSLDIKIGQMILIGVPGTAPDPTVLEEIHQGKAGSIIFFEKNIAKDNSYAQLKKMAWAYQEAASIPLFISIDQEGGRVNRLKEKYGFPRSITAAAMSSSLDSARFYGQTTAATLAGLGINVNFAPVVDVAVNPNNPVIVKTERSFSANADSVSLFAKEFIKAHRRMGVVTVLKHFPGHGSSKDDTHLGIADVTKTWNEKELTPYKALIDSGYVDAIMTAHIVNKELDKKGLPGTLSQSIMDSLLRKNLGFNGVIFSDDMQMHAITKHYGLEEAIRLAILSGVDILTFSNNIQGSEDRTVDKVHSIIRKFVENGTVSKARIDESFHRIMDLKRELVMTQANFFRTELAESERELRENRARLITLDAALKKAELKVDSLQVLIEENSKSKKGKKKK